MAYVFDYADFPSSKQDDVTNSFYNDYSKHEQYNSDKLSLSTFKNESTAFASVSSPSWSDISDWQHADIGDDTQFLGNTTALGQVARVIFAENRNQSLQAMRGTADVILNRSNMSDFPNDLNDVVLQENQFSCTSDGNTGVPNPVYYSSELGHWSYALYLANHLYSYTEPYELSELGSNFDFFYAVSTNDVPFKKSDGTYCTVDNVDQATIYTGWGYDKPIIAGPIVIDDTVFFGMD